MECSVFPGPAGAILPNETVLRRIRLRGEITLVGRIQGIQSDSVRREGAFS